MVAGTMREDTSQPVPRGPTFLLTGLILFGLAGCNESEPKDEQLPPLQPQAQALRPQLF